MRRKSLNHVRYGHGTVSIKGAVYVFGGFAHRDAPGEAPRTISLCEKLSQSNASWDMVASMNKARAFAGACVLEQQYIYAFGGLNDFEMLMTIEKYDSITDTWITLHYKLPYPLTNHAAVATDKRNILIMGGMSTDYDPVASVINLDIQTAKFTKKAPMKQPKLMDGGVYMAKDASVFVIFKNQGADFKSERYVIRDLL
ncbi:hypothetical protein FGO68_gene4104 [Halteria grandinella]|uniref:Kelch repeat protein n=1 Tax=Halteria grandinella TaxID=5974 RepID=A0A8J8NED4_HALGN|nr:hypothetical protein FGO68_gene16661 [Halteria grandinella]TNV72835.1 hypothetical protein FGO68_gene4104 [Halteria grandinella]